MMEQFVLDEAHLLDCEECGQLLQELNTQYASLSTELETIHAKLPVLSFLDDLRLL